MRKGHRRKRRVSHRLPLSTERRVRALCAGYHRRKYRAEQLGDTSDGEINALIDDALEESCEAGLREVILSDIAERRGAKYTRAVFIGESGYKERKASAKRAIARRFGLRTE